MLLQKFGCILPDDITGLRALRPGNLSAVITRYRGIPTTRHSLLMRQAME